MNRAAAAGIAALALAGLASMFLGPCDAEPDPPISAPVPAAQTPDERAPPMPRKGRVRDPRPAGGSDEIEDDGQRYALRVRVVAAQTRQPVAGAEVEIDGQVAETGADGEATLRDLRRGTCWARARAERFVTGDVVVSIPGGERAEEIVLAAGAAVRVEVIEAGTGAPLPDAEVTFIPLRTGDAVDVVTDARGRAELVVGPEVDLRVVASAPRHVRALDFLRSGAVGSTVSALTLQLARGGTVRGVVTDPDGQVVDGASVSLRRSADQGWIGSAVTDDRGRYELVVPYRLPSVTRAEAADADLLDSAPSPDFTATDGAPDVVADLRLRRPAHLDVTVVDDEDGGSVAEGLRVIVKSEDGSESSASGVRGTWTETLPPGRVTLDVRHEDRVPIVQSFDLSEGQSVKTTVHLTSGVSVSGIVVDEAGEPVGEAWVETAESAADKGSTAFEKSGDDGRFRVDLVPKGTHDLEVSPAFEFEATVVRGVPAPSDDVRIVLRRRGTIRFTPVFEDDARPPPDSRVAFRSTMNGHMWQFDRLLPSRGPFEEFWPAGTSGETEIAIDGCIPVRRGINVAAGASLDLGEIRFRRGASIRGRLVDDLGRPQAFRRLDLRGVWWNGSRETDATGAFSFTGLAPGRAVLDLRDCAGCVFSLDVPATGPVELVVPKLGKLVVIRHDPLASAGGVELTLRDATGAVASEGVTDVLGDWEIELAPGKYTVTGTGVPATAAEVRPGELTCVRLR